MTMRSKFTKPSSQIYYYEVQWDPLSLSWSDFRGKVLGPTNPADAPADSLRGQIYAKWKDLGLPSQPNVSDNGMHGSASPFEGLAERNNWLGLSFQADAYFKCLMEAGLTESVIKAWSVDPQVIIGEGKQGSIFDQLEDLDSKACLDKMVEIGRLNQSPLKNSAFVFIKPCVEL